MSQQRITFLFPTLGAFFKNYEKVKKILRIASHIFKIQCQKEWVIEGNDLLTLVDTFYSEKFLTLTQLGPKFVLCNRSGKNN